MAVAAIAPFSMEPKHHDIKNLAAVLIETTSFCNRKCGFCPNSRILKTRDMLMPWETILRTVGELKRVGYRGRVHLYGNGEPLSDDRFREILIRVRMELPENHLFISTNGDYLNKPDDIRDLMTWGLDELHISHYDEKNWHLTREAIAGVHHFGMGTLRLEFYNRGGHVPVRSITDHDRCWWAWGKAYINYRGEWCLCCSDWKGEVVWGNVNEKPLDEIWNSKRFRQCRETHATGRGKKELPLCDKCNR